MRPYSDTIQTETEKRSWGISFMEQMEEEMLKKVMESNQETRKRETRVFGVREAKEIMSKTKSEQLLCQM